MYPPPSHLVPEKLLLNFGAPHSTAREQNGIGVYSVRDESWNLVIESRVRNGCSLIDRWVCSTCGGPNIIIPGSSTQLNVSKTRQQLDRSKHPSTQADQQASCGGFEGMLTQGIDPYTSRTLSDTSMRLTRPRQHLPPPPPTSTNIRYWVLVAHLYLHTLENNFRIASLEYPLLRTPTHR